MDSYNGMDAILPKGRELTDHFLQFRCFCHSGKSLSNRSLKLVKVRRLYNIVDGDPGEEIILEVWIGGADYDWNVGNNTGYFL